MSKCHIVGNHMSWLIYVSQWASARDFGIYQYVQTRRFARTFVSMFVDETSDQNLGSSSRSHLLEAFANVRFVSKSRKYQRR